MLFYQHLSGKCIQHILFLFFLFANIIAIVRVPISNNRRHSTPTQNNWQKHFFFSVYTEIYGACKLCNYISLYMLSRTGSRGVQTASEPSCHTYRMGDSTTQFTFFVTSACKYTQIIYCLHLRLAPKVIPPRPGTCDPEHSQIFQLNILVRVAGNRFNLLGNKYSRRDQISMQTSQC